jgi:hypothetical protein
MAERLRGLEFGPSLPVKEDHRLLVHRSGLPLGLHSRLFYIPHYREATDQVWKRSRPCSLAGANARILSPADNLAHLCGHASYSASRGNLRWVCDAWLLMQRHPDLDWDTLARMADETGMAPALCTMLGYLARDLQAPVPGWVLDSLLKSAECLDPVGEEAIVLSAVGEARSHLRAFRRFGADARIKGRFLKFMFFPSRMFMQWKYQVRNIWLIPLLYARRPLGYGLRKLIPAPFRRRFHPSRGG